MVFKNTYPKFFFLHVIFYTHKLKKFILLKIQLFFHIKIFVTKNNIKKNTNFIIIFGETPANYLFIIL